MGEEVRFRCVKLGSILQATPWAMTCPCGSHRLHAIVLKLNDEIHSSPPPDPSYSLILFFVSLTLIFFLSFSLVLFIIISPIHSCLLFFLLTISFHTLYLWLCFSFALPSPLFLFTLVFQYPYVSFFFFSLYCLTSFSCCLLIFISSILSLLLCFFYFNFYLRWSLSYSFF